MRRRCSSRRRARAAGSSDGRLRSLLAHPREPHPVRGSPRRLHRAAARAAVLDPDHRQCLQRRRSRLHSVGRRPAVLVDMAARHADRARVVRHCLLRLSRHDPLGDGRASRHAQGGARDLQHAREPLHLAGHYHAAARDHRDASAQRLCSRPARGRLYDRRHARASRAARAGGGRGRARPRAHAHPQSRYAAHGGRGDLRGHLRLHRRHAHPALGLSLWLVADTAPRAGLR